jgi:DNA-binding transcriptional LysR family regulator
VTDHELPEGAHVTHLFDELVGPVLAPKLAERLDLKAIHHLARASLLHTRTRPKAWASWASRVGWSCGDLPGVEYEHFYFLLEAAMAGLGVCIAPWPLVIDDMKAGRLVAPFGFVPSGQSYVAIRRPRRNRGAQAFCTWLMEEGKATERPAAVCEWDDP